MPPLKGIPSILPADLLWSLSAMGHGDEIVIADINFPSFSTARSHGAKFIDMSGHGGREIITAILTLFPLDQYVQQPAAVMQLEPQDKAKGMQIPIWKDYQSILDTAHGAPVSIEYVERFAFYERSKRAFAVVASGEGAQYSNMILKKGVISPESEAEAAKLKQQKQKQ